MVKERKDARQIENPSPARGKKPGKNWKDKKRKKGRAWEDKSTRKRERGDRKKRASRKKGEALSEASRRKAFGELFQKGLRQPLADSAGRGPRMARGL